MGLMASTRTLLENHIYVFNGQLYLQKEGGPIGDNVTMISSELVMFEFVLLYKQKLLRLTLYSDVLFIKVYVDDLNQCGDLLPYGTWYANGKMYRPGFGWTGISYAGTKLSETEKAAIERNSNELHRMNVSIEVRERFSAAIFRRIANKCLPLSVKMIEDVPSNHSNGKLPILDTMMWIEEGQVRHSH